MSITEEELIKAIYDSVQEQAFIPGLLGGRRQPLADYFTELVLLPQEQQVRSGNRLWEQARREMIGEEAQIQPLPLTALFSFENVPPNRGLRQILFGTAGSGKSTFCQYLAWCCIPNADNPLPYHAASWQKQFILVLPIRLKRLLLEKYQEYYNVYEPELSLSRILYWELLSEEQQKKLSRLARGGERAFEESSQLINEWLGADASRRILFVLDGLDEIISSVASENLVGVMLRCLLRRPYVFITSRPLNNLEMISSYGELHRQLETRGFLPKNIHDYVSKYLESKEQIECFLYALKKQPFLYHLSRIPLLLHLLCRMWEKVDSGSQKELQNVWQRGYTAIYQQAMVNFIQYAEERRTGQSSVQQGEYLIQQNLLVTYQPWLSLLGELAYRGFTTPEKTLAIEPVVFKDVLRSQKKQYSNLEIIFSFGLLIAVGQINPDPLAVPYEFLHLSFQEYLVAYHLTELLERDDWDELSFLKEFLKEQRFVRRWENVWRFLAGQLHEDKANEKAQQRFWQEIIWAKPYEYTGLAFLRLLAVCLEETRGRYVFSARWENEWVKAVRTHLAAAEQHGFPLHAYGYFLNTLPYLHEKLTQYIFGKKPQTVEQAVMLLRKLNVAEYSPAVLEEYFGKYWDNFLDHSEEVIRSKAALMLEQLKGVIVEKDLAAKIITCIKHEVSADGSMLVARNLVQTLLSWAKFWQDYQFIEILQQKIISVEVENEIAAISDEIQKDIQELLMPISSKILDKNELLAIYKVWREDLCYQRNLAAIRTTQVQMDESIVFILERVFYALGSEETNVRLTAWQALGLLAGKPLPLGLTEELQRLQNAEHVPIVQEAARLTMNILTTIASQTALLSEETRYDLEKLISACRPFIIKALSIVTDMTLADAILLYQQTAIASVTNLEELVSLLPWSDNIIAFFVDLVSHMPSEAQIAIIGTLIKKVTSSTTWLPSSSSSSSSSSSLIEIAAKYFGYYVGFMVEFKRLYSVLAKLITYATFEQRSLVFDILIHMASKRIYLSIIGEYFVPCAFLEQQTIFIDILIQKSIEDDRELREEAYENFGRIIVHASVDQKSRIVDSLIKGIQKYSSSVLEVIGEVMAHVSSEQQSIIIDSLIESYKFESDKYHEHVYKAFANIIIDASVNQKDKIVERLIKEINTNGAVSCVYEDDYNAFVKIMVHISPEQRVMLINSLIEDKSGKRESRENSCKILAELMAYESSEEQQILIINSLIKRSNHDDKWVRQYAYEALGRSVAHAPIPHKSQIINFLIRRSEEDNDIESSGGIYYGLSRAIAYTTSPELQIRIIDRLIKESENKELCRAVYWNLSNSIRYASPQQKTTIINKLMASSKNDDVKVLYTTYYGLKKVIPYASLEQQTIIINDLINKIQDRNLFKDKDLRTAVYDVLSQLQSYVSLEQQAVIINSLIEKIQDEELGEFASAWLDHFASTPLFYKVILQNNRILPVKLIEKVLLGSIKTIAVSDDQLNEGEMEQALLHIHIGTSSSDGARLFVKLLQTPHLNYAMLAHALEVLQHPSIPSSFLALLRVHQYYPQKRSLAELIERAKTAQNDSSNTLHELADFLLTQDLPLVFKHDKRMQGVIFTPEGTLEFASSAVFKQMLSRVIAKKRGSNSDYWRKDLPTPDCRFPGTTAYFPGSLTNWNLGMFHNSSSFTLHYSEQGNLQIQLKASRNQNEKLQYIQEALNQCPSSIKRLSLSNNALKDEEIGFLVGFIKRFSSLRVLILNGNHLTENGLTSLLVMLKGTAIHKLAVVNNWIAAPNDYFKTRILPVCEKQLDFLDLSLNAIPKGYIYKNAGGYALVLPEENRKLYFEDEYRQKYFSPQQIAIRWQEEKDFCEQQLQHHPVLYNKTLLGSIKSFLTTYALRTKEKYLITTSKGIIAFIVSGNNLLEKHGFLILETLSQGQREFIRADLYERDGQIKTYICYCTPKELIRDLSSQELDSKIAYITEEKKEVLLQSIFNFQDQQNFERYGLLARGNNENCFKWALEQLVKANIIEEKHREDWFQFVFPPEARWICSLQ